MLIVVLDSNRNDNRSSVRDIEQFRTLLGEMEIVPVYTVGEFLLGLSRFREADIIVTEKFLRLRENSTEDAVFAGLSECFPDVTTNWNHREGGERLVRWMRQNGMKMTPVLFHTDSCEDDIARDVYQDEFVYHHKKTTRSASLPAAIRLTGAVKRQLTA